MLLYKVGGADRGATGIQPPPGFGPYRKFMNRQPHVLLVCTNPALMQARKVVLGTYFDVRTAARVSDAAHILSEGDIDLIVLCETLSDSERSELALIAGEMRSRALKLALRRPEADHQEAVVEQPVAFTREPLQLLKECADTLGVILSPNQRTPADGPLPGNI
jgi:hypothetical protein